jgi:hypothetical protein
LATQDIVRSFPVSYSAKNVISESNTKKIFGNKLKSLTPVLLKKLPETFHVLHGQGWMSSIEEEVSIAKRKSMIKKMNKKSLMKENPYIYKGKYVTGSGADPVYVFV